MAEKKLQPIIVKRVKKGGHAVHGGAWKIAYADFMTAMMAFFLLMWLLGSTTEGTLQGLAEYFNNPVKVAMTGGQGSGNSSSVISGGGSDLSQLHGQVRKADSTETPKDKAKDSKSAAQKAKAEQAKQDEQRIKALQAKVDAIITENPRLNEYRSQIRIDVTPDGLQIQIVDDQNRPMFDSGSAVVKPYMRDILRVIGAALSGVESRISLAGHTDATPYGNGDRGYSNWELSADRSNASRRELVASGMSDTKLARVVGLAASDLLEPDNPRAPANRRITITVLTREAEERLLTRSAATAPTAQSPNEKPENPAAGGTASPR